MMDLERFELSLDRHGAVLDRWPAGDRAAAEALLAQSPPARVLLAETLELEALIPLRGMDVADSQRMALRAMASPQARPMPLAARRAGWAAAVAAALLLGLLVGHGGADSLGDGTDHILTAASDPLGQVDVD